MSYKLRAAKAAANLALKNICRVAVQYECGMVKLLFVDYVNMKPITSVRMIHALHTSMGAFPWRWKFTNALLMRNAGGSFIKYESGAMTQPVVTKNGIEHREQEFKLTTLYELLDKKADEYINEQNQAHIDKVCSIITQQNILFNNDQVAKITELGQIHGVTFDDLKKMASGG